MSTSPFSHHRKDNHVANYFSAIGDNFIMQNIFSRRCRISSEERMSQGKHKVKMEKLLLFALVLLAPSLAASSSSSSIEIPCAEFHPSFASSVAPCKCGLNDANATRWAQNSEKNCYMLNDCELNAKNYAIIFFSFFLCKNSLPSQRFDILLIIFAM